MTLADPKAGGWIDHELLTHGQMNAIRTELLKAIDGVGGGTYSPSAPLVFDAASADVNFDADVNVGATGVLTIDGNFFANSLFAFSGQGDFDDDVNVNDRWYFRPGGETFFTSGNVVHFFSLLDLGVASVLQAMRVPLVPLYSEEDISGFTQTFSLDISTGGWLNNSLGRSLYFVLPIMAGDVLNSVTATVMGNPFGSHGADPAQKMRLRVLEAPTTTGAYTAIATQVDAATGAGYDAAHLITASTGGYTALDRHYLIEWRAEASTNALPNANTLFQLQATLLRNQLVSSNSFGS